MDLRGHVAEWLVDESLFRNEHCLDSLNECAILVGRREFGTPVTEALEFPDNEPVDAKHACFESPLSTRPGREKRQPEAEMNTAAVIQPLPPRPPSR